MKASAVNPVSGNLNLEQPAAAVRAGATGEPKTAEDDELGQVAKAVDLLNKNAAGTSRQTRFVLFEDTHRIYVEVVDRDTNQVIATYPPKQILQMAEALQQQVMDSFETTGKEVK